MAIETGTDRDRLGHAFALLRDRNYFAEIDLACCLSCALYEVPAHYANRAVFTHSQDMESIDESGFIDGTMYIAWAGDPHEICQVLSGAGFPVLVPQNSDQRIGVRSAR